MTTIRTTAAAAVCVAVLTGLGVGWANDAPPPTEPERIPAPVTKALPAPPAPNAPAGPHVHKTANFVVEAPTAVVARALGEEYERQRKATAVGWLGRELPAWVVPAEVRVKRHDPKQTGSYVLAEQFRAVPGAVIDSDYGGGIHSLESLLGNVPRSVAGFVLTTHLGRRIPEWAAGFADSPADEDSPRAVVATRRALEDGKALRLDRLFRITEGDSTAQTYDQGRTVVHFLLTRAPLKAVPLPPGADGVIPTTIEPMNPQHTLIRFLRQSLDRGVEKAAYDVYGFDSLAQMEAEWVRWVRDEPAPPAARPADPDLIPPPAAPPTATEPAAVERSKNFAVTAPSAVVARTVTEAAEQHRRALAKRWLGAELPDAAEPLPVLVKITASGSGGTTTFTFGEADGKRPPGVKSAAMELRGPLDAVLKSVLPHEVMHVVLATHFGRPLPRWADEGIAVLAESAEEQHNHVVRARELLNAGRAIRLSTLFRMMEYPRDAVVLFAQGHSVCRFLLERGAHAPFAVRTASGIAVRVARGAREPALLAFLALGSGENTAESWALAAKEVYGFDSLDALEEAWLDSLRDPPARPAPRP